jgi:PAS domain S-box-containing protein
VETTKKKFLYVRSLIEASLDPFVTINVEGKIMDVNEALVKVTGLKRESLIGTDFSEYFTQPSKAREGYLQAFEKGFISGYSLTIKHISGKLTDILYNASVYRDESGAVMGVFVAARDVTEQKWAVDLRIANEELAFQSREKEKRTAELIVLNNELIFQSNEKERRANELAIAVKELAYQQRTKERRTAELIIANKELAFQNAEKLKKEVANKELEKSSYALKLASQYSLSLIEASRDPLITISSKGKITDMNEAMVRVTGTSREELKGSDFKIYFTDPEKASNVYHEVFKKGFVADYPLTLKDHTLTDVLFNGSVYKDDQGNVMGAVIVARDITEQKRVEKELLEAIALAKLAAITAENAKAEAEDAAKTAKESVKAKQQFLSNMSHEIRTPLNAIIGFTKVVLRTELTIKQREYLTAIKMSGDALIVLINDILDLAKVDAGKLVFEQTPFRMALSISAMLHLFELKIHEKNLKLIKTYDDKIPEVLLGDSVRLHQIILNLVSNAVKFTNSGSITVAVRLIDEDEEKVKIEFAVADTGIGIRKDKLEKIFENFQQASSGTSRLYGGTGLGLAIVKQLVEQQGGEVKVSSQLGIGSTFSFTINFNKTTVESLPKDEMIQHDEKLKNVRVLVVEDIPLNQLLMKTLLDDFGFERDIAANGQLAIEKLQKKDYDIILMDLQMPIMNGFETTKYIRNTLKLDIPIVALTADVTTVDLAQCKAVGMTDYVAKPVDEKVLYNKIVGLVKKKSLAPSVNSEETLQTASKPKCIDLQYLTLRTKADPKLMMEMISLYLEQTPPLINSMKESLFSRDWTSLYAAVHKMIPSFTIMGIHPEFEGIAKKIQEYARTQEQAELIDEMVAKLENVCLQACLELQDEFNTIKNAKA